MISPGAGLVGRVDELVLGRAGVGLELGFGAGVTGFALVAVLVGLLRVAVDFGLVVTVGPDPGGVVVVRAAVVRDVVEVGEIDVVEVGELGRGDEGVEQAAARATMRTSGATERYVMP